MKHGFVPSLACSVPPLSLFLAWLSLSLLLSMERNLHLPCGEQSIGGIRFASAVTATATTTTTTNARVKHRSRACAHPRADRSDASVSNLEDRIVATVRSNITSTRTSTSTSTSTSNNCDDACHTRRTDEEVPRSDREHDGGGWLCLRSTNARGRVSLRTLCEHRGTHESSSTIHPSECRMARDSDSDHESLESVWCWQPARINVTASNGEETIPPRSSANETDLSCSTATDVEDDAEDTILSGSTGIEVTRHKHKREREQKHIQSGPRLRSRTMDLLFATKHVRNQEISLPLSIAELFRQQQEHQQQSPHTVAPLPTDKNTSSLSPSLSPSPDPRSSSLAGPGVDLTGRWRPAAQGTDPEAYDAFLVACCSDVVSSYWTRRLLVSSSIVSRQELIVEQSEKGRVLRLVDVHPLASEAWNRTVVATLGGGDGILTRTHNANRLIDPQGDPILVEAFWQDHGRVHTTVTRKAANGDNEDEAAATSGWWHVHMYLQIEAEVEEHPANGYHETDPALMVVETTHHSTAFPSDAERVALHTRWEGTAECENAAKCKRTRKHKQDTDTDTATRMVWRWERVPEPAR